MKVIRQAVRYSIVGVMNTIVTAIVFWLVLKFAFGVEGKEKAMAFELSISNILGFTAGLLNSFFFNRKWTFQSRKNWKSEFAKFTVGFLICYIPQLILVNLLNSYVKIHSIPFNVFGQHYVLNSSLICNLAGMLFYTVTNFIINKFYTFKS